MLTFDINQPPPSRQEIEAEKQRLTALKKKLIKQSIASDGGHAILLLVLYLTDLISGYGLLAVIGLGTLIAFILMTTLKKRLHKTDLLSVIFIAIAAACAVAGTVYGLPNKSTLGCILAGVLTASIIMFSSLIGRQLLHTFKGLEELKSISEIDGAEQELIQLCRENPLLEDYRQQAREILRPNLTLGELALMREIAKE